jgi:hypothetical protein
MGEVPAVVAEDGSRAYFTSPKALAPGAVRGQENLYLVETGTGAINFITRSIGLGGYNVADRVTTGDGSVFGFPGASPALDELTGTDGGGHQQFYRYDVHEGSLVCVSCPAGVASRPAEAPVANGDMFKRAVPVSADGRSIVFRTESSVVAQDVDGEVDAYEWRDGRVGLLTDGNRGDGRSSGVPYPIGITPDGEDIFFLARGPIPATDGTIQMYDARIGGGFPAAAAPVAPCSDDDCQGTSDQPPIPPDPGSDSLRGPGDVRSDPRAAFSLARLGASQRAALAQGRRVSLRVRVNRAGRLSVKVSGRIGRRAVTVARASKRVGRPGIATVTLRLSKVVRGRLTRAGTKRLSLAVRFSGVQEPRTLTLTLTRKGR